jgi:hypothetical protein
MARVTNVAATSPIESQRGRMEAVERRVSGPDSEEDTAPLDWQHPGAGCKIFSRS